MKFLIDTYFFREVCFGFFKAIFPTRAELFSTSHAQVSAVILKIISRGPMQPVVFKRMCWTYGEKNWSAEARKYCAQVVELIVRLNAGLENNVKVALTEDDLKDCTYKLLAAHRIQPDEKFICAYKGFIKKFLNRILTRSAGDPDKFEAWMRTEKSSQTPEVRKVWAEIVELNLQRNAERVYKEGLAQQESAAENQSKTKAQTHEVEFLLTEKDFKEAARRAAPRLATSTTASGIISIKSWGDRLESFLRRGYEDSDKTEKGFRLELNRGGFLGFTEAFKIAVMELLALNKKRNLEVRGLIPYVIPRDVALRIIKRHCPHPSLDHNELDFTPDFFIDEFLAVVETFKGVRPEIDDVVTRVSARPCMRTIMVFRSHWFVRACYEGAHYAAAKAAKVGIPRNRVPAISPFIAAMFQQARQAEETCRVWRRRISEAAPGEWHMDEFVPFKAKAIASIAEAMTVPPHMLTRECDPSAAYSASAQAVKLGAFNSPLASLQKTNADDLTANWQLVGRALNCVASGLTLDESFTQELVRRGLFNRSDLERYTK